MILYFKFASAKSIRFLLLKILYYQKFRIVQFFHMDSSFESRINEKYKNVLKICHITLVSTEWNPNVALIDTISNKKYVLVQILVNGCFEIRSIELKTKANDEELINILQRPYPLYFQILIHMFQLSDYYYDIEMSKDELLQYLTEEKIPIGSWLRSIRDQEKLFGIFTLYRHHTHDSIFTGKNAKDELEVFHWDSSNKGTKNPKLTKSNIQNFFEKSSKIILRIPLIPGFSQEEIYSKCKFYSNFSNLSSLQLKYEKYDFTDQFLMTFLQGLPIYSYESDSHVNLKELEASPEFYSEYTYKIIRQGEINIVIQKYESNFEYIRYKVHKIENKWPKNSTELNVKYKSQKEFEDYLILWDAKDDPFKTRMEKTEQYYLYTENINHHGEVEGGSDLKSETIIDL